MDDASPAQAIDTCSACGGAIDVTDELPFAQIYCPHCGEGLRARRFFNNFELVALIGQGGMGSVYKAYDHTLGRMVALKVLRREMSATDEERAKLEQEARITASVNHPHVVRVYSFGEAHGQFYLAMELVEKGSLDDLMGIQSHVPEAQVLEIGVQIAEGLEAAAEQGLIHRDVKPGNILFSDAHTAKIVDFGLARVLEEEAEARGEIWGTPYYIAPERLSCESEDFRSDIYSLGGTLFHAIAGRPPFEAESASLVALKQIKSQPVSLEAFAPDVAAETAYVINRMLEKNPEDRYPAYSELIEHLEYARSKVLERAGRPAAKREVVQIETSRTKLYVALISAGVAVLLLGSFAWLFMFSEREEIKAVRELVFSGGAGKAPDSLDDGMAAIAAGRYGDAAKTLGEGVLGADPATERGKWIQLNLALSLMLDGQKQAAKDQWQLLARGGLFSDQREQLELANMFLDAAEFGQRKSPVSRGDLSGYPKEGLAALVRFFAGVNNWSLGAREEACGCLEEFLKSPGDQRVAWWNIYRGVATRLLAEQS
ncbi:MAG: serine/threonine protein kinase [Chthoniobacterales bacterium]|nr:serine/threonine protein kinase [Chthoniobacterales bacterium]